MKTNPFILLCLFILPLRGLTQTSPVVVSGIIKNKVSLETLPFVNVVLKKSSDSSIVSGTISNDNGIFTLSNVASGNHLLEVTYIGYTNYSEQVFIGAKAEFLDLGVILLEEDVTQLAEVIVTGEKGAVSTIMDKKTYNVDQNISQSGGSVLQSMSNLPGVTTQDGQVQLRGNDQVMVLIDGKQTAISGFGKQSGLDNLPASAVEKIEIINNPSAKFDANGNAGIINIVLKKDIQEGLNGKVGLSSGLGALWIRKDNLPGIRPQYVATPKVNPSVALNYRKKKINLFLQADNLYTETLNKNEFTTRTYDDGTVINQQMKRNRNTNFFNSKAGFDWFINDKNSFTMSGLYGNESINDYGDQPFFNENNDKQLRLWQFLEDEVLTAVMGSAAYEHKFVQPGHKLRFGFNYTFDRENERYFFTNNRSDSNTKEDFHLIADQKVTDLAIDYTKPMKHGMLETGFKFRKRTIPTNMQFHPSANNSVLDTGADGLATYKETIPAMYGNYTYEISQLEAEIGIRIELVDLKYLVDPNHNTYQSDGYDYVQPFPNARVTYKIDDHNKFSAFYNRRVDRPDEGDIRIFPKYDDAEIIKVGNPALNPQFTNSFEVGYRNDWSKGYLYSAVYHKISDGYITRIATTVDDTNLIYNVSQNAGLSYNTGLELVWTQDVSDHVSFDLNLNGYRNQIDAFTAVSLYPVINTFVSEKQEIYSGNVKLNSNLKWGNGLTAQLTAIYLAPDIIPQGTIDARFSLNAGVKKSLQKGKGEFYFNATDLLNTMVIRKTITGNNFTYYSRDYYETQTFRVGYNYKF